MFLSDFFKIQPVEIIVGSSLQPSDFDQSEYSVLMGNEIATQLFGKPENAVGKEIDLKGGKIATVVGLIKKQGKSIMDMWPFDDAIIIPNTVLTQIVEEKAARPKNNCTGKRRCTYAIIAR